MSLEMMMLVACLILSAANLFSVISLSNSVFRILLLRENSPTPQMPVREERNLVDPGNSLTYDERFSPNNKEKK